MRGYGAPTITGVKLVAEHGPHTPIRIVIHCTESKNVPNSTTDIYAIPNYWLNQGQGYGTQLVIDADGNTCRCVHDQQVAWGVGGRNTGSLQVEMIGFTSDSTAAWKSRQKGLKQLAKWIAYWSRTYNIPIRLDVGSGVSTHAMQSMAFHTSDHTDPGPNFPLSTVMRWAKWYRVTGWNPKPNA